MKRESFISGIFNTCDYWCERCAFTRRCRNYSMRDEVERHAHGEPACKDATNAAFWDRLADTLRETAALGPADAWEGDDVEDFGGPDPEWEAREKAHREAVDAHPLTRWAGDYMKQAHVWLKSSDADLKAVAEDLMTAAKSGIGAGEMEEEARDIGEMIEVISWYHTLIPPKLSRAIDGLLERDDANSEMLAGFRQEDADGTGKVVLIAIERSMAAWIRLREILPNHEDAILGMLALLSRMRHGIHETLPNAQHFKRPGFDD